MRTTAVCDATARVRAGAGAADDSEGRMVVGRAVGVGGTGCDKRVVRIDFDGAGVGVGVGSGVGVGVGVRPWMESVNVCGLPGTASSDTF